MRQVDAFEAAHILGCRPEAARQILGRTVVTLETVEELALKSYRWRQHVDDPQSYWVTASQAARILGVSAQRVKQLLDSDRVPYAVHSSGARLMRREQLETVANARRARRLRPSSPM